MSTGFDRHEDARAGLQRSASQTRPARAPASESPRSATSSDKLMPLPRLRRMATMAAGVTDASDRLEHCRGRGQRIAPHHDRDQAGRLDRLHRGTAASRSLRFQRVKYFGSRPRARQ